MVQSGALVCMYLVTENTKMEFASYKIHPLLLGSFMVFINALDCVTFILIAPFPS